MRHIAALQEPKVPRDAEFKFRERARALVERWQGILSSAKQQNGSGADENPAKHKDASAAPSAPSPAKDGEGEKAQGTGDGQGEKDDGEDGASVTQATSKIDLNGKSGEGVCLTCVGAGDES